MFQYRTIRSVAPVVALFCSQPPDSDRQYGAPLFETQRAERVSKAADFKRVEQSA
jgi:hypothetical protein